MKPTQEQIDRRVAEARTQSSSSVLVALADRIADLERAAETTRAEHAAALGLATARIRELEGEREGLLGLLRRAADMLAEAQEEPDGWQEWSAIVARIEKATKGTT